MVPGKIFFNPLSTGIFKTYSIISPLQGLILYFLIISTNICAALLLKKAAERLLRNFTMKAAQYNIRSQAITRMLIDFEQRNIKYKKVLLFYRTTVIISKRHEMTFNQVKFFTIIFIFPFN
jgi:hypothetical protein